MTTFVYRENKKISLNPERRNKIANSIKSLLKEYYQDLVDPKKETAEILNKIFPGNSNKIDKIPSLYEQYKTYTSAIQRACYPSYDAIVYIKGLDLESNNLAGTYKASLIYDWYNIDLEATIDKCQNDWATKGEAAVYIYWKEELIETTVEKQIINVNPETQKLELVTSKEKTPILTFKAVDVKRIDPHNLYFDKSQKDNWQSCKKIYRDFIPVQQILANTSYKLTPAEKKEIKEMVYNNDRSLSFNYETLIDSDTTIYGSTVEVLEFEGDFVDPETYEIYKNMEATIIAGKYLARFEESKKPKSSIVWAAYLERPDTGRGQSPLRIPEILNDVQNMCADLMMQSWKLNTYPTFMAPKGMLPSHVDLKPGMVVEFDNSLLTSSNLPIKMDFTSGLRGFEFSDFFQRRMENATGINQYMQGAMDGSVRTASEASYIHSGASMRMAREAYLFSHNFLYKLIRNYALFKKVYDTEDKQVPIKENEYALVNEKVRNGNYQFIIGGSQSAVEKEAEMQKIFTLFGLPTFQSLSSILDPTTASEFLKWVLNRMNFQDTDQIMEMLNLNGMLRNLSKQMGIQENNFNGFRDDMINRFEQQAPQMAMDMYNEYKTNGGTN